MAPFGSNIEVKILHKEEKVISLLDYGIDNLVFPSQPSISKGENAEDVSFYFDEGYYNYDGFYEEDVIKTELLGRMRGQQLARISVAPFQYNPTTSELKVITKLEVKVLFKNLDLEGHIEQTQVQKALEELGFHTESLNILGVYEASIFRQKK